MATYGWKEVTTQSLSRTLSIRREGPASLRSRCLHGRCIALQSARIEPRIEAVAAEAPFANLREVSYDYAGSARRLLAGKSLFAPRSLAACTPSRRRRFKPEDVSPEKAVAESYSQFY